MIQAKKYLAADLLRAILRAQDMSYLWPIKDRRESRIIYICQVLGALIGVFVFTALNRWKVGFWQVLLGFFVGWFIGAFIYVQFAAKGADTEIAVSPNATAETEKEFGGDDGVNETENRFVIESDNDFERHVDLDDPSLNHFTYYNRYEIHLGKSEFEYRIEGTRVFVRLLQDFSVDPGKGKMWDVRDGVVMEFDMRSRDEDEAANSSLPVNLRNSLKRNIDEQVANLNKQTEWCELLPTGIEDSFGAPGSHLVGLKYFILSKRVPPADARRLIRQEIERLRMGTGALTKEAAKLGLEPGGDYGLRPIDGHSWPSSDEIEKLVESIPAFGISHEEFRSREWIVALLERLLAAVKA